MNLTDDDGLNSPDDRPPVPLVGEGNPIPRADRYPDGPSQDELDSKEAEATVRMYAHLTGIDPGPRPELEDFLGDEFDANTYVDQMWIPVGDPVIATGEDYRPPVS